MRKNNFFRKCPEVKRATLIIFFTVCAIFILCGCNNHGISGTYYKDISNTFVFYDTGKVKYEGKEKTYKYIGDDVYIINPGANEKYAKVKNNQKEIIITDKNGRYKLKNTMPDPNKLEKENAALLKKLEGNYKGKDGEVTKHLKIKDNIASLKIEAAEKVMEDKYIIEVRGSKVRLSNANGIKGEYSVKLTKEKLKLYNEYENIIYEREK